MRQEYGVILLERDEVIIRIYKVNDKEWKLNHYQSIPIKPVENKSEKEILAIIEILSAYFSDEIAEHVGEWKMCARFLPQSFIKIITEATGIAVENLTNLREQELLCKGMFTELW